MEKESLFINPFEKRKEEKGLGSEQEKNEVMEVPEIVVRPEKGITLMSIMMKGCNFEWVNQEHDLVKKTEEYFENHPLDSRIKETIEELEDNGVDEESLYNLALTYENPDRSKEIFNMLRKHKEISDIEWAQKNLIESLSLLDEKASLDILKREFEKFTQEDVEIKKEQSIETQKKFQELINFFQPKKETTKLKKVTVIPEDFLYRKSSGKNFELGEEIAIMSSSEDSIEGQAHEFLHSVINPITYKLEGNITEDQKKKIVQLASGRLKEDYGEDAENWYSLLNETIIRVYLNFFEKGESIITNYENFYNKAKNQDFLKSEEKFNSFIEKEENEATKKKLNKIGITSRESFFSNAKDFFENYIKNDLGEIIFRLYEDYEKEREKSDNLNFEDFLLDNFNYYLEGSSES